MASVDNEIAVSDETAVAIAADRMSKLEDKVLHRILSSRFSLRESVILAALARRYRALWTTAPDLLFDDLRMGDEEGVPVDPEFFPRFVDTVLLRRERNAPLSSFVLRWQYDSDPERHHHLHTWCRYATNHHVPVLELDIDAESESESRLDIPSCVFTSETLEELKLSFGRGVTVSPRRVGLPRLKKMHFSRVRLDGDSVERLVSGCPALEKLVLVESWLTNAVVRSDSLKCLVVGECAILGEVMGVSCPNLLAFRFVQNFVGKAKISLENLEKLVEASVFTDDYHGYTYDGDLVCFLRGLCHAKSVELISSKMQSISEEELSELGIFHNLKRLIIGGWHMGDNFGTLAYFLESAPNLEMLTLRDEERCLAKHSFDPASEDGRELSEGKQESRELVSSMQIESEEALEPREPVSSANIEREDAQETREPVPSLHIESDGTPQLSKAVSSMQIEREAEEEREHVSSVHEGSEDAQETREPVCTCPVKIVEYRIKCCRKKENLNKKYLLENGDVSEKVIVIPHEPRRESKTISDEVLLNTVLNERLQLLRKSEELWQQGYELSEQLKMANQEAGPAGRV